MTCPSFTALGVGSACIKLDTMSCVTVTGSGWVEVLGGAAGSGDTVSLVVPATKLFFAKAVEAARGTPCAGDVTATGKCGVPLLAGHLKVLLLSRLCSSRCGKPGAV